MKRRILSLITALTLCLSLLPGLALAADEEMENKSGGWVELIAKTMPVEKTVFKAGSGTITWEPVLGENGVPVSGTVTLNNAEIDAQNGGIVLTVPFTLKLEGKNTITTRVAGPITETGEHCGVSSRLDSLIITGPGSLTVNSAGRAIEAKTNLTVEGGADVTVQSQGTQFGLTAQEGNLTIRDESTVHVSLVGSQGSHNAISANNGTVTIENSHVFSKCQNGAAIEGLTVVLKNSDVAAIGNVTDYSGVIHFLTTENGFCMDGGTLYVKNTGNNIDFQFYDNTAAAINNAVIFYNSGTYNYMIPNGNNIQFAGCTYDETNCKVTGTSQANVCGNLVWDSSIPAPPTNFVNAQINILSSSAWVPTPASVTIPEGMEAEIPAVNLPVSGGKLVNNGTLTCIIGIRCFGTIEGGGTLNSMVQTREVIDASTYNDTFTAHGDATFRTSFTKIGATRTTSGITTKNMIAIPAGTSMTIPAGNVLDATASGTITKDTLEEYYTNNGTLIVNGTAKFPADTDISALGTITGTGTITIGSDSWYTVNVTGGTADKTCAKAGDIVTLTVSPITGKTFYGWIADDSSVTFTKNADGTYSFTMPSKSVTVTAQYQYTVTFNSRGGSDVASQSIPGGSTAAKPSDPTRDKCTFIGWYTDAAGTTAFDFTTPITDDLTLYAKWNVPVESISLSQSALSLTTGGTATITVVFTPTDASNQSVSYSSSNPAVATVDESGNVTAVSAGTATITVTTTDGDKTAICAVTVTVPVTNVTLNKTSLDLTVGGSEQLTATVAPDNATNKTVTWTSSNTAVATVDASGNVTAVGAGSTTITVTTADGSKTAACAVSVTVPIISVTGVTLNKTSLDLTVGGSERLTAAVAPSNATNKTVTWTSGNPTVATVDVSGNVTAVGAGSTTITVTTADGSKTAACEVSVTVPIISVTGVTLNKTSLDLTVGASEQLTATVAPDNATNKTVTWTSGNTAVATVDNSGNVTAVSAGTASITVTTADGDKTAACTVTVRSSSSGSVGGGSSTPATPAPLPVSTSTVADGNTSTTETTAVPPASTKDDTATASVDQATGSEIVKQAKANDSENVIIAPKITGDVTKTEVSIPASTVGEIGSQTNASLTVSTPVADVIIPNGGLESLSSESGTVAVTVGQKDGTVELTITADGKTVEDIPGGVTVVVPVADTTPGTVAVLVHEDGTREVVRKSIADSESITIPLDGSAKLEIVDNSKQFSDVPLDSWMADAVAFTSARELFNGTGKGEFSPDLPMSRGMLAVVFYNLENNPEQAITGVFDDVDSGRWYTEGITWAETNGIVSGYGNGLFGPNDDITREQLAVMLWRYAGSPAAADRELHFADADEAADWAQDALCWAVENGIITGKGNGILDPTGNATRAEAAAMLMRYLEDLK